MLKMIQASRFFSFLPFFAERVWLFLAFLMFLFNRSAHAQHKLTDSLFAAIEGSIEKAHYAQALGLSLKAIKESEKIKNDSTLAWSYYKTGESFYLLKNNPEAIIYLHQALHMGTRLGDQTLVRKSTRYLGGIYFEQVEKDSASYYLKTAYTLALKEKKYQEIASAAGMLGETYHRIFNILPKASEYYAISLENALQSGDSSTIGYAYIRYGAFIIKQGGNCIKGRDYTDKALAIFRQINDREGELWALQTSAFAHKECGDINIVFNNLMGIIDKQQIYFHEETANKTAEYKTLYETEKKDAALNLKNLEIEKRKQQSKGITIIAIALIVALLAIISFIIFYYRSKQKITKLEAQEQERNRIARDLHDHLGSNVSYIISKTGQLLANEHGFSSNENIMQVKDAASQIMLTLRETIWALNKSEIVNTELADKIKQYISKNLLVEFEINDRIQEEEAMAVETAMAIYRCVQEIINNINKHSQSSSVHILMDAPSGKIFCINIKDDGVGFDSTKSKGGYGLRNMKERMKEIGAEILIATVNAKGTEIKITLP